MILSEARRAIPIVLIDRIKCELYIYIPNYKQEES
jgi:hypothetical protein